MDLIHMGLGLMEFKLIKWSKNKDQEREITILTKLTSKTINTSTSKIIAT